MLQTLRGAVRDLLPILLLVGLFQLLVLKQPLPLSLNAVFGLLAVVVGLALFVRGLELGLFPLGQSLAVAFARRGSLPWLLLFAFALGFSTTVAEPALIAIAAEAARVAVEAGVVAANPEAQKAYAWGLRMTVALAVGLAILVGVLRIVLGWSVQWLIIGGYVLVVAITPFAPDEIIGVAYDAGGVTTSTITVPLVTALGIGLASSLEGRNPVSDGFGLIAFASLTPMVFVMLFGMWW